MPKMKSTTKKATKEDRNTICQLTILGALKVNEEVKYADFELQMIRSGMMADDFWHNIHELEKQKRVNMLDGNVKRLS